MNKKIRGKIIRILNTNTIVINLGRVHGITEGSIFGILGEPEIVVDPFTKEELGTVSLLKGRVKAITVSEKFTIASSKWNETYTKFTSLLAGLSMFQETHEVVNKIDEELRVRSDEIRPWRAISEELIRTGDEVEVTIEQLENAGDDSEMGGRNEPSAAGEEPSPAPQ